MKKILSLLCICLFMLFSALKSSAENIKFVQITDVHLSNDSEYSQKVLKSAVEDIKKIFHLLCLPVIILTVLSLKI